MTKVFAEAALVRGAWCQMFFAKMADSPDLTMSTHLTTFFSMA
jgi:hypothetical protein